MSFERFEERMRELKHLESILGLLGWDQEVNLPPEGHPGRGQQNAALEGLRHQRLVDPMYGDWIEAALADAALEPLRRAMLLRARRQRDRAVKLPERLVKALAEARSRALASWQKARRDDRFADFAPDLETILTLTKESADALRGEQSRYDALLDEYEPDMTTARLTPVLAALREGLVPLAQAIADRPAPDTSFLAGPFPVDAQWDFTLELLPELGFNLARGRQDRSTHPFSQSIGECDVRLTTRLAADDLLMALFSTIHEAGHGMYEQGFVGAIAGTSLAQAPSFGLHESQSRLWENQIARSLPFWRRYLPRLAQKFPALAGVSPEAFFQAVNEVRPGLIRTEADEVTYNLHILLRYELELALFSGDLSVRELPDAFREKVYAYLGLFPETDREGCLQDIHWASGAFGYFPTYSIGNLYSAQLMAAYQQHADVEAQIEAGQFAALLGWLREHVHRHGYQDGAEDTIRAATGQGLEVGPLLDYLNRKYRPLYGL